MHPAEHTGLDDYFDECGHPMTACCECGAVWRVTKDGTFEVVTKGDGTCDEK